MGHHGRMEPRWASRAEPGHVHLTVADLDRSLDFYTTAFGFDVTLRLGDATAFLSAGGQRHHIGLSARNGSTAELLPWSEPTGASHVALRYPDRPALGQAIARLRAHGVTVDRAVDHGLTEAVYLRDPDGHRLELYWDRPRADWPLAEDGSPRMMAEPIDPEVLVESAGEPSPGPAVEYAQMDDSTRGRLRELRTTLLHLHKVLLEDARHAYEMDRGRVGSTANLLQLVINDPWFAWLHALSELVIRIDQAVEVESPATEADAAALVEQVGGLLTASETGDGFARRYYEALQRQPAVVLAHADVRRRLKAMRH
jgi:catechol 2,3-dioxygenase